MIIGYWHTLDQPSNSIVVAFRTSFSTYVMNGLDGRPVKSNNENLLLSISFLILFIQCSPAQCIAQPNYMITTSCLDVPSIFISTSMFKMIKYFLILLLICICTSILRPGTVSTEPAWKFTTTLRNEISGLVSKDKFANKPEIWLVDCTQQRLHPADHELHWSLVFFNTSWHKCGSKELLVCWPWFWNVESIQVQGSAIHNVYWTQRNDAFKLKTVNNLRYADQRLHQGITINWAITDHSIAIRHDMSCDTLNGKKSCDR